MTVEFRIVRVGRLGVAAMTDFAHGQSFPRCFRENEAKLLAGTVGCALTDLLQGGEPTAFPS